MIAYSLNAHDYSYLPYQAWAIRRFMPDVERLVVVEGPFRATNQHDSKIRIDRQYADELDVDVMTIGDCSPDPTFFRIADIVNAVLALPGDNLVLQGDAMPDRPLRRNDLLQGCNLAGRAFPYDGQQHLDLTWLLSTQPMAITGRMYGGDLRAWPSRLEDADLHIEYCEPGFVHLDKIVHSYKVADKLKWIQERLGVVLDPPKTVMAASIKGVGDHMHDVIYEFTGEVYRPGCNCKEVVQQMNRLGPAGVRQEMPDIVAKLKAAAGRRNWWMKILAKLPGATRPIKWMVREAIRRTEAQDGS